MAKKIIIKKKGAKKIKATKAPATKKAKPAKPKASAPATPPPKPADAAPPPKPKAPATVAKTIVKKRDGSSLPPPPAKDKAASDPAGETFKFSCVWCGQKLKARVGHAGQGIQCPSCDSGIDVPTPKA